MNKIDIITQLSQEDYNNMISLFRHYNKQEDLPMIEDKFCVAYENFIKETNKQYTPKQYIEYIEKFILR